MPDIHSKFHSVNGKRLVLVVDDEFINREIVKVNLEDKYEVITAGNGMEALAMIGFFMSSRNCPKQTRILMM